MPLDHFKASQPLAVSVELELQLVSLSDFGLVPSFCDMQALLRRAGYRGNVAPAAAPSMIVISTSGQAGYANLLAELRQAREPLLRAGDRLNVGVCGGGTHPFQQGSRRQAAAAPVYGLRIEIGCRDGEQALYFLHALNRYIPHFIALSASSPFLHGQDTQFNSARLHSAIGLPFSGRAFHWDLRPKPEHGAIELRVCDTPLFVERAAALAGYLQLLCRHLLDSGAASPREDDYLVYDHNRFQACRFGLDAAIVHPQTHETTSLREDILTTLRRLEPHARASGSSAPLDHLYRVSHAGSDAHHLRRIYEVEGSTEAVVRAALERFRQGEAE